MFSFPPLFFYPNSYPIFNLNDIRPRMVDATFVLNLVETVGILVGVTLAINEIRRSKEERRNQFSLEFIKYASAQDHYESWINFLRNMGFSTFEEWSKKYGLYANPEAAIHWYTLMSYYNVLGQRVLNGQIDLESVLLYLDPIIPLMLWEKSLLIFEEWRERFNFPYMLEGYEYIVNELKKRHPSITPIPNPQRQRLMQR